MPHLAEYSAAPAADPAKSARPARGSSRGASFPDVSLTTLIFATVLAVIKPWAASGGWPGPQHVPWRLASSSFPVNASGRAPLSRPDAPPAAGPTPRPRSAESSRSRSASPVRGHDDPDHAVVVERTHLRLPLDPLLGSFDPPPSVARTATDSNSMDQPTPADGSGT